eukprot:3381675-Rhodomonas_salina.2
MKGRIDRPGQPRDELELVVVLAANTVEEAEVAATDLGSTNTRLPTSAFVGPFFGTTSRRTRASTALTWGATFELHAIDASFSSGKIQVMRFTIPYSLQTSGYGARSPIPWPVLTGFWCYQAAFRKRLLAPSLDAADDAAPGYKKRKGRDTEEAEESDQEDGQGREKEEKRADKGSDSASAVGSPSPKKGNGKGATAAPWVASRPCCEQSRCDVGV